MHTKNHVLCFLEAARDLCRFYPLEEKPYLPDFRMPTPTVHFPVPFRAPTRARTAPNVTSIEKRGRGGGCPVNAGRRRRHQSEATEGEEGDATHNLLLKHSDETLIIYVRNN